MSREPGVINKKLSHWLISFIPDSLPILDAYYLLFITILKSINFQIYISITRIVRFKIIGVVAIRIKFKNSESYKVITKKFISPVYVYGAQFAHYYQ